jgi:hypothetical protein
MIRINVIGKNDKIEILGHAMYDDFGKDIVCAGVSSVVITIVNAILTFNKDYIKYNILKDSFTIEINNHNEIVDNLINNMINMLKELESDYPKNIKIRKEN